jgi:hypothetical protein
MMPHRERTDADRAGSLMSRWSSELRRHVRDVVLRSGASGCCCALADPGARGSLPLCLPLQKYHHNTIYDLALGRGRHEAAR